MNRKKVFIIDDDEDLREIMSYAIESEGHEVCSFSTATSALEEVKRMSTTDYPDLMIVDYLMPEMDGVTFIKSVRKSCPEMNRVPTALCSALGAIDQEKPLNIMSVSKPMELEDLLGLVKTYV